MQRMMITLLIAFAVGIVLGKAMLPVLHKLKFGQNIYELAPEAHKKKQGTPTMGGLVIAGAAIVAALIMNDYSQPLWQNMLLAMLVMALGNLCIGFVDDMTKIRRGKNGGLTPKQKMFFQTLLALAFSCYCYFHPQVGHVIQVPFFRVEWDLGIWYIPIMMFIIVGTTNSANLLDGLDGLLTSVSMVDFATLAVLCGAASLGSLGVGCAAMCLQFYAALAVGHSFANHKMALSVLFFFVFQFVVQMVCGTLLVTLSNGPLQHLLAGLNFQVSGMAAIHVAMLGMIVLAVLYGAVFYVVTTITLKKRLNLE